MGKGKEEVLLNGSQERVLPLTVRNQVIWILKDYQRLCKLAKMKNNIGAFGPYEIVLYADEKEGLISENVVNAAVHKVNIINAVLYELPSEYREGVFQNICKNKSFDNLASKNTWQMWKDRLIHNLAKKLDLC